MNEREDLPEMTKEGCCATSMDYKTQIVGMVQDINNERFLINIYWFVKGMYDKCKK